jgi:WhiB family redox-sensing transcriptional regulator
VTIRDLDFKVESAAWMKDANCTDPSIDPDWFFPDSEHPTNLEQRAALSICQNCPVQMNCLGYAIKHWPVYGVWGGMKNKDIKDLVRQIKEQK